MPIAVQQPKTGCVSKRPVVKISLKAALAEQQTFSTFKLSRAVNNYNLYCKFTELSAVKQNWRQGQLKTYTSASLSFTRIAQTYIVKVG
jgi:hypothetical protein